MAVREDIAWPNEHFAHSKMLPSEQNKSNPFPGGDMTTGTLERGTNQRRSFIQEMNEKWARKYQDEQTWLDSIDRLSTGRTD